MKLLDRTQKHKSNDYREISDIDRGDTALIQLMKAPTAEGPSGV